MLLDSNGEALPSDVRWWLCPTGRPPLVIGATPQINEGSSCRPSAHLAAEPCCRSERGSAGLLIVRYGAKRARAPAVPVIS